MRTSTWIISAILVVSWIGCAYNPAMPDEPFLCGPGGKCPDGFNCYGGICMKDRPACMDPSNPEFLNWPDDSDLEPNNDQELAVVLPCGEDPYSDPEYSIKCPNRENYTNGFMNLVICPGKDKDFYKIFLMPEETITFQVLYQYGEGLLPRDINARIWRFDFVVEKYIEVMVATSTNDNETLTLSTDATSGNPQGWYYIEVNSLTEADVNFYTISFTLNPTQTTP